MTSSTPGSAGPDSKTLLTFALFVIVSGGASVAIRFTYAEIPPFSGAAWRFLLGAVFFWAVVLIRKLEVPRGRALTGAILFGVFSSGLPFIFIYWGLVKTPASLYQTIVALVPLLTIFFAFLYRLEPFRPRGLLGAVLTVIGIVIAVGGAAASDLEMPRVLAIVAGAACFAEAGIVAKVYPRNNPYLTNAVGMTTGGLMLLGASIFSGEEFVIPELATTWIAFAYILVFVTIIAFIAYLYVLGHWTASGTSYSFVLIPLVTVVVASTLANEQITVQFLIGAALVLLGVWIGALSGGGRK